MQLGKSFGVRWQSVAPTPLSEFSASRARSAQKTCHPEALTKRVLLAAAMNLRWEFVGEAQPSRTRSGVPTEETRFRGWSLAQARSTPGYRLSALRAGDGKTGARSSLHSMVHWQALTKRVLLAGGNELAVRVRGREAQPSRTRSGVPTEETRFRGWSLAQARSTPGYRLSALRAGDGKTGARSSLHSIVHWQRSGGGRAGGAQSKDLIFFADRSSPSPQTRAPQKQSAALSFVPRILAGLRAGDGKTGARSSLHSMVHWQRSALAERRRHVRQAQCLRQGAQSKDLILLPSGLRPSPRSHTPKAGGDGFLLPSRHPCWSHVQLLKPMKTLSKSALPLHR
jgi:hypothetical protein